MRTTRSSYLFLLVSCHLQLISSGEERRFSVPVHHSKSEMMSEILFYWWKGLSHYLLMFFISKPLLDGFLCKAKWWTNPPPFQCLLCNVLTANTGQTPSSSWVAPWTISSTLLTPPSRPSGPAGSSSQTSRTSLSPGESSGPADTMTTSWSVAATLSSSLSR